ncbi:MAG TPA: endopeptidase La [Clostridia bacterium]
MAEFIPNNDEIQESAINNYKMPRILKMIALRGLVIFPYMSVSFDIARDKSLFALNKALENDEQIFLVTQKHASQNDPAPKDIYRIGTICKIKQVLKMPGDTLRVLAEGIERAEIESYHSIKPYFEVVLKDMPADNSDPLLIEAMKRIAKENFEEYSRYDTKIVTDNFAHIDIETEPEKFVYAVGQYIYTKESDRQELLSINNLDKKLQMISESLAQEIEVLKIKKKIDNRVRKQMDKNQKEYYLREQARAIHEELGDGDEDLVDYINKAKELKLPQEAMEKVEKEVKRLQKMSSTSPEAGVSRSYIEWILDIPWTKATEDNLDLQRAREILNEDHFGLEKVKERILEYLAVLHLTKTLKGPILCFVGPPGVGKTSIVKSIARALGRNFVSMSLGGVKDEAEIRGHRRTYIGAIPGRIIYHMKQAGTTNPVFLFDEIDKMSSDFRGDPASAMLEVLDPEQNYQFRDHYLEIPYDLSKVMFITTANSIETIHPALIDRMEVIELSGYTEEEKYEIATKFLLPKQMKNHGLDNTKIEIEPNAMYKIINNYTGESGVRSLEREIAEICRKVALDIVEKGNQSEHKITSDNLIRYLGVPKYRDNEMNDHDEIGASTGLAWTSIGGKTLTIEVSLIDGGKGDIILTGNLGDVMKESCRTAISLIKARAKEWNIDPTVFNKTDIHIHVPEGATPKDGPSAGITIATAILSAFTQRAVKKEVAMTGEVTLRGKVLPIGGLKEKMLAAKRMGIKKLIIPKENEKDLIDIPDSIKEKMEIIMVDDISSVFKNAIV